jgi:hypothetical protein
MKQMLTDLVALLKATAAITALVGQRIYPGQAPQGAALPTILYHEIARPTEYTQDGFTHGVAVIQFDIDGRTATECRNIAEQLFNRLSGLSVVQGSTQFEGVFHDGAEFTSVSESLTQGTTQAHRLSVDYRIQFRSA